jgi:hypothetical protein
MNEPTVPSDPSTGVPGSTTGPGSDCPDVRDATSAEAPRPAGGRRSREKRFFFILLGCAAALSLMVGVGLVVAWRAGSIVVEVREHGRGGDDVRIRVPAAAGDLALLCLPDRAFAGSFRNCVLRRGEMRALVSELERIPDGTVLVQVDSPSESVRISRDHGLLLIHVASDQENVRVEVPVRLAGAFLKRMDRSAWVG